MGTITVEQMVSVDGFAADADGGLAFTAMADFPDASRTDDSQMRWIAGIDAILLGRATYEMFNGYWPYADPAVEAVEAVATPIDALPKHVVSSTLDRAPWGDAGAEAEVLRDGAIAAAEAMRERSAATVVWGSLQLTDALLDAGLVDELRLRVVPVAIGTGRSFTPAALGARRLALRDVERHETGHVTLTYGVAA